MKKFEITNGKWNLNNTNLKMVLLAFDKFVNSQREIKPKEIRVKNCLKEHNYQFKYR